MADSARQNTTLYVSSLPQHPTITASYLTDLFIPFGEILSTSLPKNEVASSNDLHRGFGYVEFEDAGDAKEAIGNMDLTEVLGRVIRVSLAREGKREMNDVNGVGREGALTAVWERQGIEGTGAEREQVSTADEAMARLENDTDT